MPNTRRNWDDERLDDLMDEYAKTRDRLMQIRREAMEITQKQLAAGKRGPMRVESIRNTDNARRTA